MHEIDMTDDDAIKDKFAPPPRSKQRLTLRTFRPLLVPLVSLAIAVSIIFVAGQQPQTQPPFDNSDGWFHVPAQVGRFYIDPPPVAQGQTMRPAYSGMVTVVRNPANQITVRWSEIPAGTSTYRLRVWAQGQSASSLESFSVRDSANRQKTDPTSGVTWTYGGEPPSGEWTTMTLTVDANTQYRLRLRFVDGSANIIAQWPNTDAGDAINTFTNWYPIGISTATPTPSPTATATATATPMPPIQPGGLTSTGICLGGIDLNWNDVAGATSYIVLASTDGGPNPPANTFSAVTYTGGVQISIGSATDASSARISGLSQTARYHFAVQARNSGGDSPLSAYYPSSTLAGVLLNTGGNCATIDPPTATPTATSTATPTPTPTPRPVVMCGNDCPLNGYSRDLADAVVAALDEASTYNDVTVSLLASVTELQFRPSYLAPANDFRGMDSLERLDIRGHRLATGDLPPSFFAGKGLNMLRILHMGGRAATSVELERYQLVLTALDDLRFSDSSAPVDIFRIEPNVRTISIRTGDEVRLSVHIYGGQDKRDDSLADADSVSFAWVSDGGGSFSESAPAGRESNGEADDRKVLHTVPDTPGTYKVTASLDGSACAGNEDQCKAEFTITASRSVSVALSPTPVPCVLSGTVPSVLSDSSNVQYSVFTPADGGVFLSDEDGADVTAGAGSVPGCEYIGVRMDRGGDAEDLNRAGNRYTLAGDVYSVTAVDSSGNEISDYEFATPVQVCVPLPVGLRGSITELGMASINDDDSLTLLTHRIVSASDGSIRVCGALGSLPAEVSAAKRGEPESPTPMPDLLSPTPESPDAGGASVPYSWVLLIAVLGVGVIMLGSATLRRRNKHLRA